MGGTVRGITRLFGGVPRRRDPGQRSMYVDNIRSLDTSADIVTLVRPHHLGLPRCMPRILCALCVLPTDTHPLAPLRPTMPSLLKGQNQSIRDR